jgi:formate hydrogenlyase subunit 3/multisubunit Na+/H+ antiporter MnhD subunit
MINYKVLIFSSIIPALLIPILFLSDLNKEREFIGIVICIALSSLLFFVGFILLWLRSTKKVRNIINIITILVILILSVSGRTFYYYSKQEKERQSTEAYEAEKKKQTRYSKGVGGKK